MSNDMTQEQLLRELNPPKIDLMEKNYRSLNDQYELFQRNIKICFDPSDKFFM